MKNYELSILVYLFRSIIPYPMILLFTVYISQPIVCLIVALFLLRYIFF